MIKSNEAISYSITVVTNAFDVLNPIREDVENQNGLMGAQAFFSLAVEAFRYMFYAELSKLFDSHKDAYTIKKHLNVCERHLSQIPPDLCCNNVLAQIKPWKQKLQDLQPTIDSLIRLRNEFFAHHDPKCANNLSAVATECPLKKLDLLALLDFAKRVVNGVRLHLESADLDYRLHADTALRDLLQRYYRYEEIYQEKRFHQ